MSKLLLIDGDQVVYEVMAAAESEYIVSPEDTHITDSWMFEGDTILHSDVYGATLTVFSKLRRMSRDFDRTIVCFTSTPNFRHSVLSTYKGGRLTKRKPLGYWKVVKGLCEGCDFETRKIPGLEADDVMSILATNPKYYVLYDVTIFSQDKDMKQVPDVNITNDSNSFVGDIYTLPDANLWRYTQALAGDRVDGYDGLKGYGPVKAGDYLADYYGMSESSYIDAVRNAYVAAGLSADDADRQINCARILRYGEYDFKTKQPILVGAHDVN